MHIGSTLETGVSSPRSLLIVLLLVVFGRNSTETPPPFVFRMNDTSVPLSSSFIFWRILLRNSANVLLSVGLMSGADGLVLFRFHVFSVSDSQWLWIDGFLMTQRVAAFHLIFFLCFGDYLNEEMSFSFALSPVRFLVNCLRSVGRSQCSYTSSAAIHVRL